VYGSVTIVADENIPYVSEAFGDLGRVRVTPGRAMTAGTVKDADILLVRSVTRVNEQLLGGSNVKMVATATVGTDHVDQAYLSRSGIAFADAAGSNANSVAEYVTAAILTMAHRDGMRVAEKVVGVIGVGNVGSKVVCKCRALGMTVLKNDPPVKDKTGSDEYIDLPDLLAASDIVTLHVPLTVSGRWPTYHMVDGTFLNSLRAGCLLVNTSRGSAVDGQALNKAIGSARVKAVLDVWENEPNISVATLAEVAVGTPHIAGYSLDGKVNGTQMIYDAVCGFLGEQPTWRSRQVMPAPQVPVLAVDPHEREDQQVVRDVVRQIYDIEEDDRRLREIAAFEPGARSKHFDQLRKHYPVRREFFNTELEFAGSALPSLAAKLTGIGFRVRSANGRKETEP